MHLEHGQPDGHDDDLRPDVRAAQGLGFPNNSAQNATPPFFNKILEGLLEQPMFSVRLNPDLAAAHAGEIEFGSLNPARFSGSVTW